MIRAWSHVGLTLLDRLAAAARPWRLPVLREELARFPERNSSPVMLVSREARVLYANDASFRVLAAEGLPASRTEALLPEGLRRELQSDPGARDREISFDHRVGERLFAGRANLIDGGRRAHVYLTDVTRVREAEAALDRMRRFDPLTGLLNRASFEDRVTQALSDAGGRSLAIFLIELDRVDGIAEAFGLPAVDAVIRGSAERADAVARGLGPSVEIFRYQEHTLAGLMTGLQADADPARLAERLIRSLGQPFAISGSMVSPNSSIGLALAPADGDSFESLLRSALVAAGRARADGGNTFRCHTAEMDAMARDWLVLEGALRGALADGDLALAYQPQVRLADMRKIGSEALLRWAPLGLGSVRIDRVIEVAEASGLIAGEDGLGAWALFRACADASAWTEREASVAVNVSARQFHEPGFLDLVSRALASTGLAAPRLDLEITETVAMGDEAQVLHTLGRLKDLGVCLSIDDFGVGYSSLSSLRRFPIDRLKIDRSFVSGLGEAAKDLSVTRSVIDIGHRLGLKVLAEGVETEGQLERLSAWGCDEAQGYLLGRPA